MLRIGCGGVSWYSYAQELEGRILVTTVDDRNPALRTLHYRNYSIFLIMGNAGFISSTVLKRLQQ